jgi:hypothetical protein
MNMKNLSLVADWHQGFLQRANLLLHTLCSLEMKLDELLLALIKHLGLSLLLLLQFLDGVIMVQQTSVDK